MYYGQTVFRYEEFTLDLLKRITSGGKSDQTASGANIGHGSENRNSKIMVTGVWHKMIYSKFQVEKIDLLKELQAEIVQLKYEIKFEKSELDELSCFHRDKTTPSSMRNFEKTV
jgi:hypothetical protein